MTTVEPITETPILTHARTGLIDRAEVQRAYNVLVRPGQVIEARLLEASFIPSGGPLVTIYGYFDNASDLIEQVTRVKRAKGFYFVLNPLSNERAARVSNRLKIAKQGDTTADTSIASYAWLPIDIDVIRPSGVPSNSSATNEEKAISHALGLRLMNKLTKQYGWPEPLIADSGNGLHLLYAIDIAVEDKTLIARVLQGLADNNDDLPAHVDTSIHNPARIIKMYGTLACKGDNTPDRPHRMSRIVTAPEAFTLVSKEQLEAIARPDATQAPKHVSISKAGGPASGKFDLEQWISSNGIAILSEVEKGYALVRRVVCPFNPEHRKTDAAIYSFPNGGHDYKCSHSSCSANRWEAFREYYEPGYKAEQERKKAEYENRSLRKHTTHVAPEAGYTDALDKAIADKDVKAILGQVGTLATLSTIDYISYEVQIKNACPKINLHIFKRAIREERDRLADEAGEDEGENENIDMDNIATMFYEQHSDTWAYDMASQCWREWVGTHWQAPINESDTSSKLDKFIVDIKHANRMEVNSIGALHLVHRLAQGKCKRTFTPTSKLINFQNGTLHIDTMQLTQHNKRDEMLYCLEYNYVSSGAFPSILTFLCETLCKKPEIIEGHMQANRKVTDVHAVQAFMAHVGLALMQDTSMHFFEFLFGATRAGKSTLMRLANAACGVIQRGPNPLVQYSSFADDHLFSQELEGKRARFMRSAQRIVCADELSTEALKQEEMIKNMSAHSGVGMRGMMKDDKIDNAWIPKLLMSSNNLPRYKDTSSAVKERVIYLSTPYQLAKEDRDPLLFEEKLLPELAAFSSACIDLGKLAIQRRYYPQSADMKRLANEAESGGDAMKAFIEECCVLEPDARISIDALYNACLAFRTANGYSDKLGKKTLTSNLRDMNRGVHNFNNKAQRYQMEVTKCVGGIRLRRDDEECITPEVEDDALLLPYFPTFPPDHVCNFSCNLCNPHVTDTVTLDNGSTGRSMDACNFVTHNSINVSMQNKNDALDTAIYTHTDNIIIPIETTETQKTVTKLQSPPTWLAEPIDSVTNAENARLQESYNKLQSAEPEEITQLRAILTHEKRASVMYDDAYFPVEDYLSLLSEQIESDDLVMQSKAIAEICKQLDRVEVVTQ